MGSGGGQWVVVARVGSQAVWMVRKHQRRRRWRRCRCRRGWSAQKGLLD